MKKNTKSVPVNSFISLICLAASAFCVYLFYKDLNTTLSKQNESPIARIINKEKTVQRKFFDRVLWDRVQNDSSLYNYDTVRTAKTSIAVIGFPSGASLELTGNSLVTIFLAGTVPAVDLAGGRVNIDTSLSDSGFVFQSGGNVIEVAAGGVSQAAALNSGGIDFRVIEGEAKIISASGEERLEAGSGCEISRTPEDSVVTENPMVVVRSPLPSARIISPDPHEYIDFNVTTINKRGNEQVIIEIAADSAFTDIVHSSAMTAETVTEEIPAGVFYWRAYLDSQEKAEHAAVGRMEILQIPQTECVTPQQDQIFNYKTQKPFVKFSWTHTAAVDSYNLIVADNSRLESPVVNTVTRSSIFSVDNFNDGTWYWQVTPVLSGKYSGGISSSKIASFTVRRSENLPQPLLIFPGENAAINLNQTQNELFFSWKNVPEAVKYIVEISHAGKLLTNAETDHNLFSYRFPDGALERGDYEWRIMAFDKEGNYSAASRSFSVDAAELVHRALYPPLRYTVEQEQFSHLTFSWETNIAEKARFQIARDVSFKNLTVDSLTAENSISGLDLESGTYFWRIVSGNVITSEREITIVPPIEAPDVLSPPNGSRVSVNGNYAFRWTHPEGAEFFNVRVYRLNARGERAARPVFSRESLTTASVTVNFASFDSGNYLWTIEPFTRAEEFSAARTGQTAEARFVYEKPRRPVAVNPPVTVPPPPAVKPPVIVSPQPEVVPPQPVVVPAAVQPRAPLEQAVITSPRRNQVFPPEYFMTRREINFTWRPVQGAQRYTFKIIKDGAALYQAADLTECAFTLTDLTVLDRGTFAFQIEAIENTEEGTRTSAALGIFIVSIPPMSVPHIKSPEVLFAY